MPVVPSLFVCALASLTACSAPAQPEAPTRSTAPAVSASVPGAAQASAKCPIPGAVPRDELIREGERHFVHLWQVTRGIANAAEGYWSFASDRITAQITASLSTCDRILVTDATASSWWRPISNAHGVTTCSYFMPGDREVLYASTHAFHLDCPPRPDMSRGYVWDVHPEFDVYVHDLATGAERALTTGYGYDAEATVSPRGDRIVFTSTRSGDLELWTCDLAGQDLKQVTRAAGYDGGAFFSNDGQWLIFRSTVFTAGKEEAEIAEYEKLLADWKVKPMRMELMIARADGSERRQLTSLGKANWAPFFFPDDKRVLFATNHHDDKRGMPNFDLFAIGVDGTGLERITFDPEFDSFAVFSPDGRWLCFASNRGGTHPGETNLFVAQWR